MPAPVLAAPLVIPFAEAIGVSIAALGMAKATDKVNEFIQENPEQSMKIFQMIMPSQGIANALKNKSSEGDEEVSEDIDVEVEEKPKLTGREKGMRIKEAIRRARAGKGNYSSPDAEGSAVDIGGSVIREVEDMGIADKDLKDNYDPTKPKFDYKKFFRNRKADGGSAGIASMMPSKKIKGQDHILAYITPKEADKLVALGGKETMTKEGILAYPEFDNYGYSSQQDFDQGNYGRSNDPTVSSYAGGNNLTDQTNVNKKITEEINKKLNELKPPVIDHTKQKFDNLEKFRTLKKSPISFAPFRFERPKNINKTLFDSTISELALSYPDLDITNEFGTVNTDNLKTVIDSAVLKGDLSPIDGLTLTQSITTQGDPSSIGLSYDNNLVNFSTPNINEGDYTLGTNYQIGDLGVGSMFDVKNDSLAKKNLSFNYGDGTLKGSQVTYPGSNFQTNELGLNKDFNVTDNIDVNVKGDLSNVKLDGGTLYTDKSLTPTVTFNKNIGDGSISLSGSKEIIDGGSIPNVNFSGSYPLSNNSQIGLTTDNLLSKDRTGNLSYTKNIGNYGDNTFLDASAEVNPFNPEEYTGMLKLYSKFSDGGRVGLFMGGSPLTGQALAIYNSMNAYGFDDQAIANALLAQGLYTPGSSTPETTTPNIINQQLQTGGGGDNNFGGQGIGKFGNLDPNTLETMQVEVADGMGGTKIVEKQTALTAGGLRRTLDNKNPVNAGIDVKPMAITIMEALMGKKNDSEFDPEGKIYGTFNNPNYKDLSFFGKIKEDYSRQKELKQLQKEFELQEKLKKQIAKEEADRAAQYGATNYGQGVGGQSYSGDAIGAGNLGFGIGATTGGPVSNRTGGGRQDYSKGGLATMFKEKR
jgi:hypothetical protein